MEILFQDPGIVVCRKEAGMDSERDVPQALKAALGGETFPVHRLDRGTAGLMVYARSKQAAAALSRAIANGAFQKRIPGPCPRLPTGSRHLGGSAF